MNKGFTLVEVLVAAGLIAIIGLILSVFLAQTFQGANKTQLVGTIKQNGQSALTTMDQTIRFASKIICPVEMSGSSVASPSIIIQTPDNQYVRFGFYNSTMTTNGVIAKDILTTTPDSSSCPTPASYPSGASLLTDQDTISGVALQNNTGAFILEKPSNATQDVVNIKFNLCPGVKLDNQCYSGGTGSVQFQTSVLIR